MADTQRERAFKFKVMHDEKPISHIEMCGTSPGHGGRNRDRDQDQKKNFTGTRTGTEKKITGTGTK